MQSGWMPPIRKVGHDNPAACCVTLPQQFDGDFDQTVRHLTSVFEQFTDARDNWLPARHRLATVRVLRSATILGIAAREAEDLLVAAGADLTDMGDPRVAWFTVASAAIVAALRDFAAERLAGNPGHA